MIVVRTPSLVPILRDELLLCLAAVVCGVSSLNLHLAGQFLDPNCTTWKPSPIMRRIQAGPLRARTGHQWQSHDFALPVLR